MKLRPVLRFVRRLATPMGRSILALERRPPDALLQPYPTTRPDRHPLLFGSLVAALEPIAQPHLLSFGCATGEEAFALADRLPHATIDAIDINPRCIALARNAARRRRTAVRFMCADRPPAGARYDAILCLSVLRHGRLEEQPAVSTAILSFARAAAMVEALDKVLKPGGLLLLWGSQFRFPDMPTAARYKALPTSQPPQSGPFYGRDDHLLQTVTETIFLFRKLRDEPPPKRAVDSKESRSKLA